jgi:eukaryotic-like serine/threonine-protein kinase
MNEPRHDLAQKPPGRHALEQIHAICNRFESCWGTDTRLSIESLLTAHSDLPRWALLESLIRSELELQRSSASGDATGMMLNSASEASYQGRFPSDPIAVARAFLPTDQLSQLDVAGLESVASATNRKGDDIPRTLGPYEVIDEFARGGMGIIYRARHKTLGRVVALKLIASGAMASSLNVRRFRTEAKAIASLEHPHIVPIFDIGECDGIPYFTMPLIQGTNLAARLESGPLPPRDAARMTKQVADAIEYAHSQGIIHRDLKPRNILIDPTGNIHVTDFGLAKFVDAEQTETLRPESTADELTMTGQLIGTPAYMAPEQAIGQPARCSDIYSLGAILYALTTGRPPFQAATLLETLRLVREKDPVDPSRLNPAIPKDLETIALTSLSKSPSSRYASAKAMADDLQRFIDGVPIVARPVSSWVHFVRWVKRQPRLAAASAIAVASLVAGIAVSLWFYTVALQGESKARENLAIASANEQQANKNFDFAIGSVKQYFTDVASSPDLKSKGLQSLRVKLLENAQQVYQQLQSQSADSAIVQSRLADVHQTLGEICQELGTWPESSKHFNLAIELHRTRQAAEQNLDAIATCLQRDSEVKSRMGDAEAGGRAIEEAIALRRQIHASKGDRDSIRKLAGAIADFGLLLTFRGREQEELEAFDEVASLAEQLVQIDDRIASKSEAIEETRLLEGLALHLQGRGKFSEGERWIRAARDVAAKGVALGADDVELQYRLARTDRTLAMILARLQRFDEARASFDRANETLSKLTAEHPLVFEYLDDYAASWINIGSTESMRGRMVDAIEAMKQAYRLQSEVVQRQPENAKNHTAFGMLCSNYGLLLQKSGAFEESEKMYNQAIANFENAFAMGKTEDFLIFTQATTECNLGGLCREQRRDQEAIQWYRASIARLSDVIQRAPTMIAFQQTSATALLGLGTSLIRIGERDQAAEALDRSLNVAQQFVAQAPQSADAKALRANVVSTIGELWMEKGDAQAALQRLQEATAAFDTLFGSPASAERFRTPAGLNQLRLSACLHRLKQWEPALKASDQAIQWLDPEFQQRASAGPAAQRNSREAIVTAHLHAAASLANLGDRAAAQARLELASTLDAEKVIELREGAVDPSLWDWQSKP